MALALVLVCACSGSQSEGDGPFSPTAEPKLTSAAGTASEAPTEPAASGAPSASAPPAASSSASKVEASEKWQVASGSAKGLELDSETGQSLKIAVLSYTSALRQSEPLNDKDLTDANVRFATITADGATATEVVCKLPAWEKGPDGVALIAAVPALVIQDAAPTGALLKNKKPLLACAGGKALRVRWTFESGKVIKAVVLDGNDKSNACVLAALERSVALESGMCVATITP